MYMPWNKVCVLLECFVCYRFGLRRIIENCMDSVQANNMFYYNILFMLRECINDTLHMNTVSLFCGRSYVAREGYNLWRCVSAYSSPSSTIHEWSAEHFSTAYKLTNMASAKYLRVCIYSQVAKRVIGNGAHVSGYTKESKGQRGHRRTPRMSTDKELIASGHENIERRWYGILYLGEVVWIHGLGMMLLCYELLYIVSLCHIL